MTINPARHGVVASRGLRTEDYAAIIELANICNRHDGITLKLNESMLRSRPDDETSDFLYFDNGHLVGFLGLYQFNSKEVELSGMVHPAHRRKGYFSALVEAAKAEATQRQATKLIFINAEASSVGKLSMTAIKAEYAFSEYWMKQVEAKTPPMPHPMQLRQATPEDAPFLAHTMAIGFDLDEAELLTSTEKDLSGKDKSRTQNVIELDGTPIGAISINFFTATNAFIYGFVILPEHRGRGYGRQALAMIIQFIEQKDCTSIELEVACENKRALTLYESCGFEVQRANDYYVLQLDGSSTSSNTSL